MFLDCGTHFYQHTIGYNDCPSPQCATIDTPPSYNHPPNIFNTLNYYFDTHYFLPPLLVPRANKKMQAKTLCKNTCVSNFDHCNPGTDHFACCLV